MFVLKKKLYQLYPVGQKVTEKPKPIFWPPNSSTVFGDIIAMTFIVKSFLELAFSFLNTKILEQIKNNNILFSFFF